jgi:hypothetical protein
MATEQPEDDSLYKDAMKEFGMKGTVIPAAGARAQTKTEEGVAANHLGAHYPLHTPVEHNIVEFLPNGEQKVTKLDSVSLGRLQRNNSTKGAKPIGYAEAIANKNGVPQTKTAGLRRPLKAPAPLAPAQVATLPRTMVKFEGTFGRLSVPFHEVYQDIKRQELLVLVQHNVDGNHFEAPESEDYILVETGETQYLCLSGVQFTSQDGQTHYTIFVIDFARMEAELANQG